jgi:hypothetical protein
MIKIVLMKCEQGGNKIPGSGDLLPKSPNGGHKLAIAHIRIGGLRVQIQD